MMNPNRTKQNHKIIFDKINLNNFYEREIKQL